MTFKTQLQNDLGIFFNTNEFAQEVLFVPTGYIPAVVDYNAQQIESGRGNYVDALLILKKVNAPVVEHNQKVEIDGKEWQAVRQESTDDYTVYIRIRRDLRASK